MSRVYELPISEDDLKQLVVNSSWGRQRKLLVSPKRSGWDIKSATDASPRIFIEAKGNKRGDGDVRKDGHSRDYVRIGIGEILYYPDDVRSGDEYYLAMPESWKNGVFAKLLERPLFQALDELFLRLGAKLGVIYISSGGGLTVREWRSGKLFQAQVTDLSNHGGNVRNSTTRARGVDGKMMWVGDEAKDLPKDSVRRKGG